MEMEGGKGGGAKCKARVWLCWWCGVLQRGKRFEVSLELLLVHGLGYLESGVTLNCFG